MGTHAICQGLNQRWPVAVSSVIHVFGGHGIAGKHIVSIHLNAWNPKPFATKIERNNCLGRYWRANCPLVVLTEKHQWRLVYCREQQCLADITLGCGTITKVGNDRLVDIRVSGSDYSVEFHSHGVTSGMQNLSSQNNCIKMESGFFRIPATVIYPTHHFDNRHQINTVSDCNTVLSIAREHVIVWTNRVTRTYLRCLLPNSGNPKTHLTLALQGGALIIESPDSRHVFIEL